MEVIDYAEAWRRWFEGQRVTMFTMWGLPIIWWARIGKLIQFGAGLTVVLDLIGADRLAAATRRIGAYGWSETRERVNHQLSLYTVRKETLELLDLHSTAESGRERQSIEKEIFERQDAYSDLVKVVRNARVAKAAVLVSLVAGMAAFGLASPVHLVIWGGFVTYVIVSGGVSLQLIRLVGIVGILLRSAYALLVLALTVPILWIIGANRPGHPIRWGAFVAFIIGFHFDLLGA